VNLLSTCVIDAIKPGVGFATAHTLERMGDAVVVTDAATCCGQPAWTAGHAAEAARVAGTNLRALAATAGDVVVPSGSCATMIRVFWRELFELHGDAGDRRLVGEVAARTYELSEGETTDSIPYAYQRSCHMLRELGIGDEPEPVLDAYAGDRRPRRREAWARGPRFLL
jgi:L-lactate dehydrogenase complex protein LldE